MAGRCVQCKRLTVEEWVHRLNVLASDIEEDMAVVHPSAWKEVVGDRNEQYRRLAHADTCDCEKKAS